MRNGRCRIHGGKSLSGLAHPRLTAGGRYSRSIPTALASRYAEAQSDPELSSVRDELALLDARTSEVLERIDSKEAHAHWLAMRKAVEAFLASDSGPKRDDLATEIATLSGPALTDYAVWAEVLDLIERRRKLAETETKRLAQMGQLISAERFMLLIGALTEIIRRHVTDRATLTALGNDITRLVSRPDPPK